MWGVITDVNPVLVINNNNKLLSVILSVLCMLVIFGNKLGTSFSPSPRLSQRGEKQSHICAYCLQLINTHSHIYLHSDRILKQHPLTLTMHLYNIRIYTNTQFTNTNGHECVFTISLKTKLFG